MKASHPLPYSGHHAKCALWRCETSPAVTHRGVAFPLMAWTEPGYGRKAVDRAGKAFVDPAISLAGRAEARIIINNWRSSHSFPLNTLQMSLRKKARSVNSDALVAQRIKRLPSIRMKLERFPNMKLSQMHDLGGARAVLHDVAEVRKVEQAFLNSRHKHELSRHDDYISQPQSSGYRGVHLVYKYNSDRSDTYNGLRIELQLRSGLMHAWATAVETVGTFTKQSLKSSYGDYDFLRFFTLMGASLAAEEGTPFPPGVPGDIDAVHTEIRLLSEQLKIIERMEAYRLGLREAEVGSQTGAYSLLQLDISASVLTITSFRHLAEATAAFDAAELATSEQNEDEVMQDAVLVSVDSLNNLRSAYPNYFLDTSTFLERVKRIAGPTG